MIIIESIILILLGIGCLVGLCITGTVLIMLATIATMK